MSGGVLLGCRTGQVGNQVIVLSFNKEHSVRRAGCPAAVDERLAPEHVDYEVIGALALQLQGRT
jgi:hypothetical protein